MESLIFAFQQGGKVMYIILAGAFLALIIIVERFWKIHIRSRINARKFVDRILTLLRDNQVEQAVFFCKRYNVPLAKIILAGLMSHKKPDRMIQNAVDEVALSEIPRLQSRIPYLAMIAQVSLLLGLLGTIIGLIQSFTAVGSAEASEKAALLASGISKAMNTTAFGLIVAVPCMIFYTIFQRSTERIIDDIDESSVRVINLLEERRETLKASLEV
jgi:biopolymer transport protein ExbB/TolQ